MKKLIIFLSIVAMLVSCSKETEDITNVSEKETVTLTFSPYTMSSMTRSVVSIANVVTHLDVWFVEGDNITDVHQTIADDGFGTITVTLDKTKTYTLYAVGHKADGATLSDGIISFTDDKVTHSMYYTETFSPSTKTSLSCEMTRIVAQFVFTTTDACPDGTTKATFTIDNVYDRWSITSGGSHQLNRTSTFSNFTTRNDGTVTFNIYAIVTDAQTLHDITVVAYDSDDNVIQSRVFEDVPLRNNYKTTYQGTFFTDTPTAATFTIGDWNEYDVVNF